MSGATLAAAFSGNNFRAKAAPTSLTGSKFGTGLIYTSGPAAVTVQGGQLPYSYLWTRVSGSVDVFPQVPTVASTRFYCDFAANGTETAVYKCVVTDANASVVDSNTVSITITSV